MEELYHKLAEYGQSDYYPYHMPGHKRRPVTQLLERIGDIDITEIEGFDNLHHAEGILRQVQERAAVIYGAEESFLLVGGSTAGILSAVGATIPSGGKLLMARGSHKSVYHSAYLGKLRTEYLYENIHPEMNFALAVTPEQVQEALAEHPDTGAVLIVSPTYEGICCDVEKIAEIVHQKGIPLIVDGAHGAHLGFHPAWPEAASRCGADLVIQSLHKTLPAPTQTAVLHVNGKLVDRSRLRRFLSIYQTSSPSYVLMAGIEQALSYMESEGRLAMHVFLQNWETMLQKLQACKNLQVYPNCQERGNDIGKLVISVQRAGMSGQRLYDILLSEYHLQMEMACGSYVLAMFTLADTEEGYVRLTKALLEIDSRLQQEEKKLRSTEDTLLYPLKKLELWQAWEAGRRVLPLEECQGKTAAEFINLYPPGIPVAVPGEVLDSQVLSKIRAYIHENLPVHGLVNDNGKVGMYVMDE